MIGNYLNLTDVAVYGPSFFLATAIMVPSRSMAAIINPIVAKTWVEDSMDELNELYKKSSIAPFTLSIFLFLIIWFNIDLIMKFYGATFGKGKYVFLFIGLGNLMNIVTGINGAIINTSKFYKIDLFFQILLVVITITMNIVLIPVYKINGAALATGLTIIIYNSLKLLYVHKKLKVHPFTSKTLIVSLVGLGFFILSLFGAKGPFWLNMLFTFIFIITYPLTVYKLNISPDLNSEIRKILKYIAVW
jgi:O-antigen/teichoic acid export membrane protein